PLVDDQACVVRRRPPGASQLAVANEVERVRAAAQLLVQVEGSVLLRSLGLDDVVDNAFDR
ncbi:MAG: hypothetical protein AAF331_11770, partial [Pseudomonadota bacterium]